VDAGTLVVKDGYERAGFKHVKAVYLPRTEITVWSLYPASWFEEGVTFLDDGAAEANAAEAPSAKAVAPAASPKPGSPPAGAGSADDSIKKAAGALSLAKNYINAGEYDVARKKLQSIIQTYGNTPSADEAKNLLLEIKDK
jgi:TolA-binding protein